MLEDIGKYKFLSSGNVHVPGLDDVQEFQTTIDAMKVMNINDEDIACKCRQRSLNQGGEEMEGIIKDGREETRRGRGADDDEGKEVPSLKYSENDAYMICTYM